jgi:hypothetical protein
MFGLWSRLIFGILVSSQGVNVLVKISYAMEGSTKKFGRQELVLEIRDAPHWVPAGSQGKHALPSFNGNTVRMVKKM